MTLKNLVLTIGENGTMDTTKRTILKGAGAAAVAGLFGPALASDFNQAPVVGCERVAADKALPTTAKVYFTRRLDSDSLKKMYSLVCGEITGRVGIKLHTGERNGPNILPRDWVRELQAGIPNSAIVETNTLYEGDRYTTESHRETLKVNGWDFCPVDILDEDGGIDFPVNGGLRLKRVTMGKNLANYDSLIVLTHFKGHAMGGFGGSLKNIAIGCASGQVGKRQVHGVAGDPPSDWSKWPSGDVFMELMADSGKATCDHFGRRITFINVLRRMSVDCDCAGMGAAEPTISDIGILASTDILAIDQASVDLVWERDPKDRHDLEERIRTRSGLHQLDAMRKLNMGAETYQLIEV